MTKNKKSIKISLGMKIAAGILLVAVTLGAVSIVFSYQTYKGALESQLVNTATNIAKTMAAIIEPESVDRYLSSGVTDEAYDDTRKRLISVQENNEVVYAVVTKPTEKGFYYLYDTDQSDEAFVLGDFQEFYPGDFLDNKENFLAGNPIPPIVSDYEFGWLMSALVPIKDADGNMCAYVNVDLSMNEIMDMERDFLTKLSMYLVGLTLLLAIVLLLAIHIMLISPINRLAAASGDFVHRREKDAETREVLQLRGLNTKDELGNLYRSIQQMEADIYEYIDNLSYVTSEKERIGAELDVANHIQASMLPCIFPAFPERPELDIYATMTPAKEVGGDFYDFFLADEDHLVLIMADVSGKGVPAALFMVIAKTLLKNCAQTGAGPKAILEKVNNQLCENNEAEMFVTVWIGILDIPTGNLTCANAGHEYPVIKRVNGDYELIKDKHGFVLAGMEGARYREYEMHLDQGDKLYVYTDGVAEATNGQNELYGTDRMLSALNRNKHACCQEALHFIKSDIDNFVGDAPQFDDITMLMLELLPAKSETKRIQVQPSLETIGQVTEFVERELVNKDVPAKTAVRMNIAIDEIFSNIARYSSATKATISVTIKDNVVTLRFSDDGIQYNPTEKADPDITLSAEERSIGGLGIFMVKKTMDTVEYKYQNGLNVLTISKSFDA